MTNHAYFWVAGMWAGWFAALLTLHVRGALSLRAAPALTLAAAGLIVGARLQYRLESMPLDYALQMSLRDILEPGIRIPLGMVVGGLAAAAWCVLARAPWRDVGDSLAVAAMVMIPFGRLGCWINGCCLGTACPSWLPFCMTFPPGSEPYSAQLSHGLIEGTAEASLPAHPLPFYFAGVALLILFVLVRMIRQGAAPGMPLAVACILGSAGKLVLEMLRSTPRPMGPTFVIPAIVLVGTPIVLAVARLRANPVAPMEPARGARLLLLALALGVVGLPALAHAEETAREAAAREALGKYASDPLGSRRALRRLGRHGTDDLPPVVVLALGDSQLRAGRWRNAARYFEDTLDRNPGDPFETWALVGLSSSALMAGDIDVAHGHLESLEARGGENGAVAALLIGLIDAGDGKDVGNRFARVAQMPDAAPQIQDVARLMSAYVLYWRGEYTAAANSFAGMPDKLNSPELRDDALYGAAWSRMRAGDRETAEQDLRELAAQKTGTRDGRAGVALINMEQRAMLRATFQRYRHARLGAPEDWFSRAFDSDASALARAALRRLNEASRPEAAPRLDGISPLRTTYRMNGVARDVGVRPARATAPVAAAAPLGAQPSGPRPTGRLPMLAAAVLGVLGYLLLARRRPQTPTASRGAGPQR